MRHSALSLALRAKAAHFHPETLPLVLVQGWTWSSVANQEFQGRDRNDAVSACFGLRSASGRIQWTQNMPVAFLRASFVASTKLSVVFPFDSADVLGKSPEEQLKCCEAFAHRLTFEGLF